MNMICRCGPRNSFRAIHVADAGRVRPDRSTDPTGTLPLQREFARALRSRWAALSKMIPALIKSRMDPPSIISTIAVTGEDPVRSFQSWLDAALQTAVVVGNGSWMLNYVRRAGDIALHRSGMGGVVPINDRIPAMQTLAHVELQGIAEAVSTQAVRAYAEGLLTNQSPVQIARSIQQGIDKIGRERSDMLVSFIIVRAFTLATLDAYRAANVPLVGVIAERVPAARLTRDAKPSTKSRAKKPKPKNLVEVLTAGDDRVCPKCEEISEEGPYTLKEAEALIPAHPRCRCAFVPWDDNRFASVRDAFNPDQPRDDKGKWSSGSALAWFKKHTQQPKPYDAEAKAKHEAALLLKQQQLADIQKRDYESWRSIDNLQSWAAPADNNWASVEGQDHSINEPPLPKLKPGGSVSLPDGRVIKYEGQRLSSGVIVREPDGRTWLVKPKNGFGGYNYTWPKGGVEDGLSPQANAIKEAYEESGLKVRITGHAGDYQGDTSVTRMYHAVRVGGHPKDHHWETESVALVHPKEIDKYLNRKRDLKIAEHHLGDESTWKEEDHPRDKTGKFKSKGATDFAKSLVEGEVPHILEHYDPVTRTQMVAVPKQEDLNALEHNAMSLEGYSHKAEGISHNYYVFKPSKPELPDHAMLHMDQMTKVSGKMGSNEGGVYKDNVTGEKFYIKTPKSKDHVQNELTAAALYKAAGVGTMDYVPVKGGDHVATRLEALDKNNIAHFNADERKEAQRDFAVHAWLANWDAAGTGGDNQVIVHGNVRTVDTGGSLKYRAQGEPKGTMFGDKVTEIDTLRDPSKSPDAAALYGNMTNAQIKDSIKRVTDISDDKIHDIVHDKMVHATTSEKVDLIDKLIARKYDLTAQAAKMDAPTITPPIQATPEPKTFKTKTEHIKHLLLEGTTAENLKSKMGWKAVSMPQQAAATGLSLTITKKNGVNFYKGTPLNNAEVVSTKAAAAPHNPGMIATTTAFDPEPPPKSKHDITTPQGNFMAGLETIGVVPHKTGTLGPNHEAAGEHYFTIKQEDVDKADQVVKWHPSIKKSDLPLSSGNVMYHTTTLASGSVIKTPVATPVSTPKFDPPTDAELTKAKKATKLTAQYVPGAPAGHPQAEALISEFNAKYEGKTDLSQGQLVEKVNAFKQLSENMKPFMSEQQKLQAEQQAKAAAAAAEHQAKLQAAAKAKKEAEEAKEAALMNDPVYKAHVKALEGIGYDKHQMQYAQKVIDKHKLPITAAEGTAIQAYVGSAYSELNASLRKGEKISVKQIGFAQTLNDALQKMPVYQGDVVRGVNSNSTVNGVPIFEHYEKNLGSVVTEHGFTSAGVHGKLWGDVTLYIKSLRARDIRSFNSDEGGGEVVFRKGSHFHVVKIDKKTQKVWLEEI